MFFYPPVLLRDERNIDISPVGILVWDARYEIEKKEVIDEDQKPQSSKDHRVSD
jgi:hypothetical protein